MEIIIFAVLILVAATFVAAWLGFGLFVTGEKQTKRDEARAGEILDEVFDGRRTVVHTPTTSKLRFETLVEGADARGYRLAYSEGKYEIGKTHVFERLDD